MKSVCICLLWVPLVLSNATMFTSTGGVFKASIQTLYREGFMIQYLEPVGAVIFSTANL